MSTGTTSGFPRRSITAPASSSAIHSTISSSSSKSADNTSSGTVAKLRAASRRPVAAGIFGEDRAETDTFSIASKRASPMPIGRLARPTAPGLAASHLPAGKPPTAPAKAVWDRTTSSSSCANRARLSSATANRTMRQENRRVSSSEVSPQPVDRDHDLFAIVFLVRPRAGALFTLRDPSTGKHCLEKSGGWWTARFR
jgi:hypothetical protein